ncbi:ABC transporter substrate-binding protein [Lujinxingia vulgaris]|uniref:ABC transporter substrate-binding protein n=1 Tax=Lujinxingia vulgaris TaxID=2600176 RepID=A0A5C6XKJ3_9DELT|nr:ABC transporter substrate-binding protein [Lujinxingia vulgaris]TXD38704.1 ABC transporter substrate-binding protein [Lujinxingia vulgaris]
MTSWHLPKSPERIVCLTEETTELLYLLGEERRIVGISAYTERPARAKREKPVVSAFIGGSVKKIAALKPDLIIGFSDIQAELAHDLIKANLPVAIFNQRSLQEILEVMVMVGTLVDRRAEVLELVGGYIARLEAARERSAAAKRRPRIYFEEWDEPRITAIQWVSELIEVAGGQNIFAEKSAGKLAKERFVDDAAIITANPELILASWCGKPVDIVSIRNRPGYAELEAIEHDRIIELDPAIILQPGPACLSAGLDALEAAIRPLAEG